MTARDRVLVRLCAVWLILGLASQTLAVPAAVRVVVGVPLLLLVPGYLLTAAAFAPAMPEAAVQALLAAALSLAVAALTAVVLHAAAVPIERESVSLFLVGVGDAALAVAAIRRQAVRRRARG